MGGNLCGENKPANSVGEINSLTDGCCGPDLWQQGCPWGVIGGALKIVTGPRQGYF